MRTIAIIGIFTLSAFICSCTKKATTTIAPLNEIQALSPKGMIYALPKTSLMVKVDAIHTSIIPGPYAQYAAKYLGIANVPLSAKNQWEIGKVDILWYNEADMDALYAIEPSPGFSPDFLRLTSEGLVIPAGAANYYKPDTQGEQQAFVSGTDFLDMSPSSFIGSERTTHYSRVLQDSVFIRVPVHKTIVVEKSLEDKAREAADFIFSLRKRRFDLLVGDADFVAEGKAVEVVLNEISKLEKEYLSLFIGKTGTTASTHYFNYTPAANDEETSIIFRFSTTKGVLPSSDLSGNPVLLSVKKSDEWKDLEVLNSLAIEKKKPRNDLVYYRLPIPLSVRVYDSQSEYIAKIVGVYQLGPTLRLPARMVR
ncbi:MAG: DUF4831 family protein [Tenuifilaceae bacterium]|jgi:hypothetical protein|nr:DUF4831 family protein [Bacteroidales bacterium]MDI9517656.1 DUF4831 family protein [Bacteroidota bacterium]NLH56597.1 DUF4831 family protein [Rikenellaceae bacterium]OQC65179.1 MAG: hypothetical protein BWX49_00078 [Bacteroidetes bacterium ADurb.Bin008]HNV81934.1 DUF4831 family protein [Tenuifilaceae bacterium]